MAEGGSATTRSLQETPTWALATVCFVFIFLGIAIEHLIHLVGHWLKKRRKNGLFEAVEKLKSVLILLGFMSITLAVTQRPISKICVPIRVANSMLPCRKITYPQSTKAFDDNQKEFWDKNYGGKLVGPPRILATVAVTTASNYSADHCASKGMESLISTTGINELNIFIFVLAVMQIVYSVITMALGRAKMKRWKRWEKETQTVEYMAANDPERFRFTRQTTFGRRHMSTCTQTSAQLWIKCFFRQFFHSVAKVDYLTLRHSFISAHLSTTNKSFNFQKYIQRSLEDDFKMVVGISPVMWFLVVIFLLLDVHGWNVYLWVSFLPLIMVLAIGTKLEMIVAKMALRLKDHNSVVRGTPVVEPNDRLFWFNDPQFVLTLLHFTLFMNAFEFAFFVWVTLQFGIKSCYHESLEVIVIRVVLAVMVQVVCSYVTLPIYALVTQMGTKFKKAVLEEHTMHAIKEWHEDVKKKKKKMNKKQPNSPNPKSPLSLDQSDFSSSHKRIPTLSDYNSLDGKEIIHEQPNQEEDEEEVQAQVQNTNDHEEEDDIVEISVVSPVDNVGDVEIQVTEVMSTSPNQDLD